MACGRVIKSESSAGREILTAQMHQEYIPRHVLSGDSSRQESPYKTIREVNVPDAVIFLQREHELVLRGLHDQMRKIQKRCDDLQFELHLRHVTSTVEKNIEDKLGSSKEEIAEYKEKVSSLEAEVNEFEDFRQQQKWKEIQLQQRTEEAERKNVEMKDQISRLQIQIRDLKICNSALRSKAGSVMGSSWDPNSSGSPHASFRAYDSSLDSISSSGEVGNWSLKDSSTENRLFRLEKNPSRLSRIHSSPPLSLAHQASLTHRDSISSRASNEGFLPPIGQNQKSNRTQIRKQLRLLSAPVIDNPPTTENSPS